MARASQKLKPAVETCWSLLGERRGRIWYCRRVRPVRGIRVDVRFDGAWALAREESRGDVVGFLHTHPAGPHAPSERDVRTMHAWCSAFGKPLLCAIDGTDGLHGYRFDRGISSGVSLELVAKFSRGVLIGVESVG